MRAHPPRPQRRTLALRAGGALFLLLSGCRGGSPELREPPKPAWTTLAPARLVVLAQDFHGAALPALAERTAARPHGTLECVLSDGTRRRVRMAPSGAGPEQVTDEKDGETFSAVDLDLDGRPDELQHRRVGAALRVEDRNRDGHFERVRLEEPLADGRTRIREWRDEDGDGAFEDERELSPPPLDGGMAAADGGP